MRLRRWLTPLPLAAALAAVLPAADPAAKPAKGPLKVLVACSKNQLRDYEKYLEANYNVQCFWAGDGDDKKKEKGKKDKPVKGLEQLPKCDVLLLNLYRTTPSEEQLGHAKKYFERGGAVVGLRKASHAFQNWLEADRAVFGAKYGGHFLQNKRDALTMEVTDKGKKSPLIGSFKPFLPGGGLYKYTELAPDVEVLMRGGQAGNMMPQVWSRVNKKTGARVFYARYDPGDLKKDDGCRQMVTRALFWAAGREVEPKKKP